LELQFSDLFSRELRWKRDIKMVKVIFYYLNPLGDSFERMNRFEYGGRIIE
jgi:hypothetical protein